MSQRPQPSAAVHRAPVVVARPQVGLTCVQGDAYAQRLWQQPRLGLQRDLGSTSSRNGGAGLREHRETAVTLASGPDDTAAVLHHCTLEKRVMPNYSGAHGVAVLFPETCAAVDVSE